MNSLELKCYWKSEEAHSFQGWDFSYIKGRWDCEELPWDYGSIVLTYLKDTYRLLDMGTGGGEFILTLNHPYHLTSVTEGYPPNVKLCKEKLEPKGITVKQVYEDDKLPFAENTFDMIINRHESFDSSEVSRILKKEGYFITQQVGGENDYDLSNRLIDDFQPQFPKHTLINNENALKKHGFKILESQEIYTPIYFYDVGALVYFAKIIEWEFPGFSVDKYFDNLCEIKEDIDEKGFIEGTEHRFLLIAQKQ
ncbi:methyltransferase [Vallitalea longa]|uniref:Methyltransferase n=1 Tax=Vallitalea longa TaxID=2936439 RepID=A0A9W6DFN1_9FIRM|nr:methyltransferase domain-containing protein [Vallitalea longa]GKX29642.1 methyltransferase [Vallitalea longa]